MTPRQALVRVARFHMRRADDDLTHVSRGVPYADVQGALYMCSVAVLCLDRSAESQDLSPTMVLCDHFEDRLEVRVRDERVFCRDLVAESAPWIEIFDDGKFCGPSPISYEEVSPDEAE